MKIAFITLPRIITTGNSACCQFAQTNAFIGEKFIIVTLLLEFCSITMNTNTKSCKILHIDDDPDDQQLFRKAMSTISAHSEIIEASDGAEGMEYLLLMKQENSLPCIIVLDINMPKVNGRETCIAIKKVEVLAAIPLIIFSTSSSKLDKLFFESKDVVYITKPTQFSHIVAVASSMRERCTCDEPPAA